MPDDPSPSVHNPHDKFFKEIFARLETASQFLQAYLPPRLVQLIDWPALKLEPTSFIDERLAGRSSDLLYSVRLQGEPVLLYCLFEHQSTVDADMPFRLLVYMVRIWEQWRKQAPAVQKAPGIVPIVLHQGGQPWTVSTRFLDGLALPEEARAELAPFQPDFAHVLVDLSRMPLEQIGGEWILRLALTLMKAAREDRLGAWLERFGPLLGELLQRPDKAGLFRVMLRYALEVEVTTPSTVEEFAAKIQDQAVKSDVMSIAEQLIQKGRQEGWQEGRQEGEQKGRQEGRQEGMAKGALLGRIQFCQEMLGLAVSPLAELEGQEVRALENLRSELEARLRRRIH